MSEHNFGGRKQVNASKRARRAGMQAERQKLKRMAAKERQDNCDSLSLLDRIARLDRKLGPNKGAIKERARLKMQLEAKELAAENKGKAPVAAQKQEKELVVKAPKKSSRERLNEAAAEARKNK